MTDLSDEQKRQRVSSVEIEATVWLSQGRDGWRVMLDTVAGSAFIVSDQAFPTEEDARAALKAWCEQMGASFLTVQ